jgi:hypothetical protein
MTGSGRDGGYALTEVLVASVIAAAVVSSAMAGMAGALRGTRGAEAMQETLAAGANISARLRAGDRAERIAAGYPQWRSGLSAGDRPVDPRTGAVLTRARIEHIAPLVSLELIYLEDGFIIQDDE